MQGNIHFTKMNGTGNDFIVFDNRTSIFKGNEEDFFQKLCTRKFSVGADGVLLVDGIKDDIIYMRYFNSDGKEAAMCGNGARCIAWFVSSNSIVASNAFILQAKDGQHRVEVQDDKVRLNLNPTSKIKTGFNLIKEQGLQEGGYIEVGVPHYVIFTDKVEDINLREKAPYYRHNPAFSQGTNVNYVQYLGNQIQVRTFERGVEDETLSCGTGCVASALIASQHFQMKSPITVITRGGELEVEFKTDFKEVFLTGPAEVVYEGVIKTKDKIQKKKNKG